MENILPTDEDKLIYTRWIFLYILGDRLKSQKILADNRKSIIKCAMYLNIISKVDFKTVYRGVLIEPSKDIEDFEVWLYDHNSWTENRDVAVAFSTNDTQYGLMFPPDYNGHVFTESNPEKYFCWFHHKWAEHMSGEMTQFIKTWNQSEVVLGRMI